MSSSSLRLGEVSTRIDQVLNSTEAAQIKKTIEKVQAAANQIGKAWSKSFLGYQSRVYYQNFESVPTGAHFSLQWGFDTSHVSQPTLGDWQEYTAEDVESAIMDLAQVDSLLDGKQFADRCNELLREEREVMLSVLTLSRNGDDDPFLTRATKQLEAISITPASTYARAILPRGQFLSADHVAMQEGFQAPPHLQVSAVCCAIRSSIENCKELARIALRVSHHLRAEMTTCQQTPQKPTKVFIGHGRSQAWRDLKDLLQDRLGLDWDEFNRVPTAGIANSVRLSEMLRDSAIAFLVLTGEDEQADSSLYPRMNVIHEAGLFQGRLGFSKAIILLEEGCAEFSNIEGLGQIRFPKGNLRAAFEEVRRVLEREELIS